MTMTFRGDALPAAVHARPGQGCWRCPARDPSLAYAVAAGEREGVWGGLLPDQRGMSQPRNFSHHARAPYRKESLTHRGEARERCLETYP